MITTDYLELIPAYGRDYKTAKSAREDFLAGKDWVIASTRQYCSIDDFAKDTIVLLRYSRNTKLALTRVK